MKWSRSFFNLPLRTKLILSVTATTMVFFVANLLMFTNINQTTKNLDSVYATNVSLNDLERTLTDIQDRVYEYLNTKSDDALLSYQEKCAYYQYLIGEINGQTTDNEAKQTEKNIKNLSLSYLEQADRAVQAKAQYQTDEYKAGYEEVKNIYKYLLAYIRCLNSLRFMANSENYGLLYNSLHYLEIFMMVVLVCVGVYNVIMLYMLTGSITKPLVNLANKAREIGRGNLEIALEEPACEDEVGTVTRAFNQMIVSINDYIRRTRESMELESSMKERELVMEGLLKDAQLKYYQAQINPHFLFNTLNAGLQLAMMEDAQKTYSFFDNMASFLRYRLRKNGEESTLADEVKLIDNYIYIMNVRYSGDIHLGKEIDSRILDITFPGMTLQPIVENAVNYGINGIEWEKRIDFVIYEEHGLACIRISDNGHGISQEKIEEIKSGKIISSSEDTGNGIGLKNVVARLELYYNRENVFDITSNGDNQGTEVTIRVPIVRKGV